jgi:hypothetical protein
VITKHNAMWLNLGKHNYSKQWIFQFKSCRSWMTVESWQASLIVGEFSVRVIWELAWTRFPILVWATDVHSGNFPLQTAVALPARVERHILITWKISRAGTRPTKKIECSSIYFHGVSTSSQADKNAQDRQLQRKLSNVRSARSGKATAMENCLN